MPRTVIKASNLTKSYRMSRTNTVQALRGISLEVKRGDFTALVGPSGCGKSTLMHILGLVDRSDSGSLEIDGIDVGRIKERQAVRLRAKKIGFIFQGFNLLPTLTARENIELAGKYGGLSKQARRAQATQLLTEMGLGERLNHLPNELSGGQQQRVAIARALINKPAIILADEPTGELDTRSSLEIMEMLKKMNRRNGQTFLIITHNPDVARTCKRIIRLRDGLRIK